MFQVTNQKTYLATGSVETRMGHSVSPSHVNAGDWFVFAEGGQLTT